MQESGQQRLQLAATAQAPVYTALLVGGIIVGVLLTWGWQALRTPSVPANTNNVTTKGSTSVASTVSSTAQYTQPSPLVINDQRAGSQVSISSLSIESPSWVVVYANNNGKAGNALGARLFFPADKNGSVALLRDTASGGTYFADVRRDNGDRTFSLTDDKAVSDVWVSFKAF